ncbi:hypothetical protein HIM_10361 [Hirsutella minnesotensis 3608]|uniref:Rho-GAP domain-containing protein n=1 Tax=Hirsutella minnesotensis 3608 TaxID=1043627 RepID=A0A0F7ZX78_9HYPO|nr:hypothetical protein HIM_10361 [Hirsutella minnesotensis 3608]
MGRTTRLSGSKSSQHLRVPNAAPHRGLPTSASSVSLAFPPSASLHSLMAQASQVRTSGTWTTSSGELGLLSDTDEVEDRSVFVHEYNRLAKKHGVRLLFIDDFTAEQQGDLPACPEKRGWLHRLLHSHHPHAHHASSGLAVHLQHQLVHRKSVSDLAHMIRSRRDAPKVVCIQEMVRLSGKSMLYLPQDYAPCSLVLPTCLRATAQYLAQNATTRGIFRVPGSLKVVSALFDHYCYSDAGGDDITSTVRCASLPPHIACSVHDVASTFKRLLSVLPGGILGSLALFDALVAIQSQLNGEPEFPRTKQTKVRARLIALAIGTVKSQFRRELICAVIGLLSLIGRVAEVTPREDDDSRPLPTGDLMGYHALGIIFGPLLMGDLLDQYTMQLAAPTSGMLLFPLSPPRLRRDRRKTVPDIDGAGPPIVDKILVANTIAEMLIANWRDIVRQMKSLGAHNRRDASSTFHHQTPTRPNTAKASSMKKAQNPDATEGQAQDQYDRQSSPEPGTPTPRPKRRGSMSIRSAVSHKLLPKMSYMTLSPTWEESSTEDEPCKRKVDARDDDCEPDTTFEMPDEETPKRTLTEVLHAPQTSKQAGHAEQETRNPLQKLRSGEGGSQVNLESVPPRVSSRPRPGRGEDGSDATETVMSYTVQDLTEPSHVPRSIGPGSAQGQGQTDAVSHNLGSYDGSDESSLPYYSPRCDRMELENSYLSPKGKQASRPGTALSPLRESALHRVRNLLRPATSPSEYGNAHDAARRAIEAKPVESEAEEQDGVSPTSRVETQLKNIYDGSRIGNDAPTDPVHRGSMSRTPDRFYAAKDLQSRPQSSHASPDRRWHRRVRQYASSDKIFPNRQPRIAKSHGQLGESIRVHVQSPSESSSSEGPSKRASVKAMAALFKLHGPIRSRPMSPVKIESVGGADPGHEPVAPGCRCGQLSTGTQTESDDGSQELEARAVGAMMSTPMLTSDTMGRNADDTLKYFPSLGTMVPYREQPPVAHHLNFSRPMSTPPQSRQGADAIHLADLLPLKFDTHPRGTTVLYSQIQHLQRDLNAKAEEVAQLRRQLEAQENAEVGTLSEQLRTARRDLSMWKGRAEAAERRVQVFERFTARLRGIRAVMSTPEKAPVGADEAIDQSKLQEVTPKASPLVDCNANDEAVSDTQCAAEECATGGDGAWSPAGSCAMQTDRAVMERAEKVWAAAEELLLMEDESLQWVEGEEEGR